MGAFEAIIVLSLVGFLLIATEVFVPGLVLGTLGVFCLLGAVGVGFAGYGATTGIFLFVGLSLIVSIGLLIWLSIFPRTGLGRRIILQEQGVSGNGGTGRTLGLIGQAGEALTPLRPAGTARIAGKKLDVVAESDFIEAGWEVEVVREDGFSLVVRKKT